MAISTNKCQLKVGGEEINQPVDMFVMPGSSGNTKYVSTEWLENELASGGVLFTNENNILKTGCMHLISYPDGTFRGYIYGTKHAVDLSAYLNSSDLRNGVSFAGVTGTYRGNISNPIDIPSTIETVEFSQLDNDVIAFIENGTHPTNWGGRPILAKATNISTGNDGDLASYGEYSFANSNGSFEISNLIPNKWYPIVIHNSEHAFVKMFMVKFTGTKVRYIKTKNYDSHAGFVLFPNVRDIGGWTGTDGKQIKYGKIFRGGLIAENGNVNLSEYDRKVFIDFLGIRKELDLRQDSDTAVDIFGEAVDHVKLNQAIDYTYTSSNKSTWKMALETVFNAVIKNEPIYIHCSAGADRTGSICYILERLLGVSTEDCDRDYYMTSFYTDRTTPVYASQWDSFKSMIGTNVRNFCINTLGINQGLVDDYISTMLGAAIDSPSIPDEPIEDEPTETNLLSISAINERFGSGGHSSTYNKNGYFTTGQIEIDSNIIAKNKCVFTNMKDAFKDASGNTYIGITEAYGNCRFEFVLNDSTSIVGYLGGGSATEQLPVLADGADAYILMSSFESVLSHKGYGLSDLRYIYFTLPWTVETAINNKSDIIGAGAGIYFRN